MEQMRYAFPETCSSRAESNQPLPDKRPQPRMGSDLYREPSKHPVLSFAALWNCGDYRSDVDVSVWGERMSWSKADWPDARGGCF